jgi:hypothetical protein
MKLSVSALKGILSELERFLGRRAIGKGLGSASHRAKFHRRPEGAQRRLARSQQRVVGGE